MKDIWISSDPHFNHANILNFEDSEGKKFRGDLFKDVNEMNEIMIFNHNKTVKPGDHWYCLGDVFFGNEEKADALLARLNGKKRLVVGNHDNLKSKVLQKHFEKIMLWRPMPEARLLLTHVPVHESSLFEFQKYDYNVHGHIHQHKSPTSAHINMSMEAINYTPVHIDDIIKKYGKK